MLGKLIKYDLQYIYKQLIIFYGIVLFSAIVARLTSFESNIFLITFIHEFAQGCTFGFAFGTFINATMRTWARLRQSFYGNEAYLTHTLPISRHTLWAAKFLSSIIVVLISVATCVIAFLIMFFSKDFIQEWDLENPGMIKFYLLFIIAMLCQIIYIMQAGFTGIMLGHRHNNNRIILSVVYGIVVYYIGGMVIIAAALIWSQIDPEMHKVIFGGSMQLDTFNKMLIGFTTVYIILIAATYFINCKLLSRGVNVD